MKITNDRGAENRKRVLTQVLCGSGISRTEIGAALGLNTASVSRISRDLIEAGLARETDRLGPEKRPGRKFVNLVARGEGGFIIGIGLNAFRQSVTLANLENSRIAEWVSPNSPSTDGEVFIRECLSQAEELLRAHVPDRRRFFGVGVAVSAAIDKLNCEIASAPVFGWEQPIPIARLVREILGVPLTLDTPSSAINKAEAEFGRGQGVANLTTIYCSLGFGIGVRRLGDDQLIGQEFGCVLTESNAPDGSGRSLPEACGGISILNEVLGADRIMNQPEAELGQLLVQVIEQASSNEKIRKLLFEKGKMTAQFLSIALDLCQPEKLLLAGPLAIADDFFAGVKAGLRGGLARSTTLPEICRSDMTPARASRWLALRDMVAMANLDLETLKLARAV